MMTIAEFCDRHGACEEGREWALAHCTDMPDAWAKLQPKWLIWVATQPGVLTDKELRLFAVWTARQVQHLMKDQRSLDALDVAERHANGQATDDELEAASDGASKAARSAMCNAAGAAGCAAWHAAPVAAEQAASDAAWAAAWAAANDVGWSAAYTRRWKTANAAARAAQAAWLRENTKPNFD